MCYVALTPQGRELRERKLSAWQSLWQERLARFGDEELRAAAEIIHEITGIFDTTANAIAPASPDAERSPAEG